MIKILETQRQIDESMCMDSLYVKYEVDGKIRGTTFSHYSEAIELVNGQERFKRKLIEKIIRERNPKPDEQQKRQITHMRKYKGQTVEVKKPSPVQKKYSFEIDTISEEGDFLDIKVKDKPLRFKVPMAMKKINKETQQPHYLEFIERRLKSVKL